MPYSCCYGAIGLSAPRRGLAGERLWTCKGDEALQSLPLLSVHVVSDRMMLIADAAERGESLWAYAPSE